MSCIITRLEKREDDSQQVQDLIFNRIALAYEARVAWRQVVPLIESIAQAKMRMQLACSFALLYLHNRRLAEAIEAATYWSSIPDRWVRENPKLAHQVLNLHRKLWSWAMRPEQGMGRTYLRGDKAAKALERISTLSSGMVREYRNSRVALSLLEWAQNRQSNDSAPLTLISTRQETNPLFPTAQEFDYKLAKRLGVSDEEFDFIYEGAGKLPPMKN